MENSLLTKSRLAASFKEYPFWWEGTSQASSERMGADLPLQADVVIIGGGLTGASAAHTLATAGRDVLVLDANTPGSGASSRNGGMLGRYFKHSFGQMLEAAGSAVAISYFRELGEVYDSAVARIEGEKLNAGFRSCGRIVGAITQAHKDKLFKEWELRSRYLGEDVEFFETSTEEVDTGRYVGGIRIVRNACVHPGRYTDAMLDRARQAGATFLAQSPVIAITREGAGFQVVTSRGNVRARDVLVATNGYTPPALGWFYRRLSPIKAFMVATEPLSGDVISGLRARRRTYHDNRTNSNYYQISEDGRLIFGGRTGLHHSNLRSMALHLHDEMSYFFPELQDTAIEYGWTGNCAATQDLFPHTGKQDGIHFALGYCFSGLAMAPYLGLKAASRILGNDEAAHTLFTQDMLKSVPWPKRQRWLIPLAMQYYRWKEPLPR